MKKNLVIIGKGNHSKVVLEIIKEKKDLKLILNIDGKKTLINLRRYTKKQKKNYIVISL